jgi:preprotein translocase subunit Sec61beta
MSSILSPSQIAAYASGAGFSGSALQTATAIALAESSGNPSIIGDTNITPGGSVGLWQINLAAHPEYTAADLLDPQANANAAFAVYQQAGGQFTPWTTFNTGAAASLLPSLSSTGIVDTADDEASSALSIDPNYLIMGGLALAGLALYWLEA